MVQGWTHRFYGNHLLPKLNLFSNFHIKKTMTNKRQLKKHVKYVCGELAAEILIARSLYDGFNDDAVSNIIAKIAELQVETLKNISFSFDKARRDYDNMHNYTKARAQYFGAAYNKLETTFNEKVSEIVKDMNAAMPASLRKASAANS